MKQTYWPLRVVEIIVLLGIAAAFILPLFSSSESEPESERPTVNQLEAQMVKPNQ